MWFKLETVFECNGDKVAEKYPEVLEKFTCEFRKSDFGYRVLMVNIDSIEELVKLSDVTGNGLVFGEEPFTIEIYDTWRE